LSRVWSNDTSVFNACRELSSYVNNNDKFSATFSISFTKAVAHFVKYSFPSSTTELIWCSTSDFEAAIYSFSKYWAT
jgi:hypothetical protein